jgi:hypothetical protein
MYKSPGGGGVAKDEKWNKQCAFNQASGGEQQKKVNQDKEKEEEEEVVWVVVDNLWKRVARRNTETKQTGTWTRLRNQIKRRSELS